MILILGGAASGKHTYVQSLGYADSDIADAELDSRPVLMNLQTLVAHDPANAEALLPLLLNKDVISCDEIGCGVIPIDAEARALRESVGKLCILLAQHAEKVIRMVCGIPMLLHSVVEQND